MNTSRHNCSFRKIASMVVASLATWNNLRLPNICNSDIGVPGEGGIKGERKGEEGERKGGR